MSLFSKTISRFFLSNCLIASPITVGINRFVFVSYFKSENIVDIGLKIRRIQISRLQIIPDNFNKSMKKTSLEKYSKKIVSNSVSILLSLFSKSFGSSDCN